MQHFCLTDCNILNSECFFLFFLPSTNGELYFDVQFGLALGSIFPVEKSVKLISFQFYFVFRIMASLIKEEERLFRLEVFMHTVGENVK